MFQNTRRLPKTMKTDRKRHVDESLLVPVTDGKGEMKKNASVQTPGSHCTSTLSHPNYARASPVCTAEILRLGNHGCAASGSDRPSL